MLATMTQTHPSVYTRKLIDRLGCDGRSISSKEILECLNTKTSESITKKGYMFVTNQVDFAPMTFYPSLDSYSSNPFLPMSPIEALNNRMFNDVPLIIGHNRDEGATILTKIMANESILNHFVRHWTEIGPTIILNK